MSLASTLDLLVLAILDFLTPDQEHVRRLATEELVHGQILVEGLLLLDRAIHLVQVALARLT